MKAEIIGVGSELLLGQIVNTNAQFISKRLAEVGIDVHYHTVVGDNRTRLENVIRQAESRANLIIFTGGLGPTKDDMTKETIATHLNRPLETNYEALQSIEQFFARRGKPMTDNNKKQALVLQQSDVLKNVEGMAPGMAVQTESHTYMLLPGPPHEMQPMFVNEAIPYLLGVDTKRDRIVSKTLNLYGIGEAEIETRIEHILDRQTNPTVAPLASPKVVQLRLTAKAPSEEEAYQLIQPVEDEIRAILGDYIFGIDDETLASKALEILKERQMTISAAESLTAGLFTSTIANEAGASQVLKGSVVVYDVETKANQLQIDQQWLEEVGVVSEACVIALAQRVRRKFNTTLGVGLSGVAGPDMHDGQAAGTVWIALASETKTKTYRLQLSNRRNTNRQRTVQFALYYLIQAIERDEI